MSQDVLSIQTQDTAHSGRQYDIALKRGNLAVLSDAISIRVIELITVDTDSRAVAVSGYGYTLLQASGHEMISYHWHPDGRSSIIAPHAHIGQAFARLDSTVRRGSLHKVHFPTGIVSLTSVIRLAIKERLASSHCGRTGTRS